MNDFMTIKIEGRRLEDMAFRRAIISWKDTIMSVVVIVKLPSYAAYWTTNALIEMKGHKKVMSRNRFLSILTFFHLNNENNRPSDHPNQDQLCQLLDHLLTK